MAKKLRLIACILLFCVAVTSFSFSSFANEEIVLHNYEYELLKVLGLINSEIDLEAPITKIEYSLFLAGLMGVDQTNDDTNTCYYSDIIQSNHAYAVNFLTRIGVVSGETNGLFYPDENITAIQGIKMLVNLLGFEALANSAGGYPAGHISVALSKGIVSGVNINLNELTWNDAIKLVYNSLDIDILTQKTFGSKNTFTTTKGNTILSEYHNIYKYEGIVSENYITALNKDSNLKNNEIIVNNFKYMTGTTNASSFLGQYAELYCSYNERTDENTILSIRSKPSKNSFLKINSDLISSDKTTKYTIEYDNENDKKTTAEISPSADLIYNGKAYPDYSRDDLIPEEGWIELIDNNGDEIYDVVFVWEYQNIIADRVNFEDYIIYGKYTYPTEKINLGMENLIECEKDGETFNFTEIKEGNSVALFSSHESDKGRKYHKLIISNKRKSGTVEEVQQENDTAEITISDEKYELSKTYFSMTFGGNLSAKAVKPTVGSDIKYLLNFEDKIVDIIEQANGKQYGFLFDMKLSKNLRQDVTFKILNKSGKWEVFNAAQNIRINDEKAISRAKLAKDLRLADETGKALKQVIIYDKNSENELTDIYTALKYSAVKGNEEKYTNVFRQSTTLAKRIYFSSVTGFTKSTSLSDSIEFAISAESVIFKVPDAAQTDLVDDEDAYFVVKSNSFDREEIYNVQCFDKDDFYYAGAVLCYYEGGKAYENPYQSLKILDRCTKAVNTDGEEVEKWYYWENGTLKDIIAQEVGMWNKEGEPYNKGDILIFGYNDKSEICTATRYNNAKDIVLKEIGTNNNVMHILIGKVAAIKDKTIMLSLSETNNNDTQQIQMKSSTVTIVDLKSDRIYKGDLNDISKEDIVAIRCFAAPGQEIVKYIK